MSIHLPLKESVSTRLDQLDAQHLRLPHQVNSSNANEATKEERQIISEFLNNSGNYKVRNTESYISSLFSGITSTCAGIYSNYRLGYNVFSTAQMVNYSVEIGTDLNCRFVSELTSPNLNVSNKIELVRDLLFNTPAFFLVRNNKSLCEMNLVWEVFVSTKSLAQLVKNKTASLRDVIDLTVKVSRMYLIWNLNRVKANLLFENQLNSWFTYVDFAHHLLSLIKRPNIESGIKLKLIPKNIVTGREEFLNKLKENNNNVNLLPIEQAQAFQALIKRGITNEKLINSELIPLELYQDKILARYLCAITGNPVRFPVLILANGAFKLCERSVFQLWFGPITHLCNDNNRPTNIIPGLNCLPSEIIIVRRMEMEIVEVIELRLEEISKKIAVLERKPIPKIKENNLLGRWMVNRMEKHASLSNQLATICDWIALRQFSSNASYTTKIMFNVLKYTSIALNVTTRTYSWLESRCYRIFGQYVLGVDQVKLVALDRKYYL